jgi:hypothetical protein
MREWLSNLIRSSRQHNSTQPIPSRSENLQHVRSRSIEEYRHEFITAPIGCWSHAVGTFSCVHDESWNFYPDRTGEIVQFGPFGREGDRTLFEWREVADWTIACRVTKWPEDLAADRDEVDDWTTIRYDFKTVSTDAGEIIGMYQITDNSTNIEGFWHSLEPLVFITSSS